MIRRVGGVINGGELFFGGFIFEAMSLWVFVDKDGDLGVFVDEDTGLGCERGSLRRGWEHWTSPRVSRKDFTKVCGGETIT